MDYYNNWKLANAYLQLYGRVDYDKSTHEYLIYGCTYSSYSGLHSAYQLQIVPFTELTIDYIQPPTHSIFRNECRDSQRIYSFIKRLVKTTHPNYVEKSVRIDGDSITYGEVNSNYYCAFLYTTNIVVYFYKQE